MEIIKDQSVRMGIRRPVSGMRGTDWLNSVEDSPFPQVDEAILHFLPTLRHSKNIQNWGEDAMPEKYH